ncbi:asparagine synthase (glutamine-hydrolyzing) [Bizionia paragorgiae]|uniref:asparagine synthase (glutamine-hydrolyzing) n=1 Tax=Bizionia paragorgiae TaxID=283786 RepID=A0A1H3W1I2_BIZPA|nr:asparagine synthase (glutamine-hydrolyzing) [Bizionia paragorgiae]SDZ80916.1 asparagine synthase (glutamine-hydrolysing) [Bizionia paragorgiae]
MCGILGSINIDFNEETLNLIEHRGPDDFGIKTFNLSNQNITFGHRRLSIVDLSKAGHQPMTSYCHNFEIIFNGEIYNHLELREKLRDITFNGTSDTETIINYISKYGMESVKDFNGVFAFAILDKKKSKIHLVRDPFGVKPLYFYKTENSCIFSSEIKPILNRCPNLEINKKVIAETLKLRYSPSPDTLFSKVEKVSPGTLITIDFSDKVFKYSKEYFASRVPKTQNISFEKALEDYEFYFERAVKRQLLSDVELGVLLSGGVDSAMVAYYAQKHSAKPLKAFTVGFSTEDDSDEIEAAKYTAKCLGLEHYYKKISFDDFLSLIEKSVKIVEEPLGTTSIIPMYYLSELAKEHVTVVLTGQGADEPLGGYNRYQLEVLLTKTPKVIRPLISSVFKNSKNEILRRGANAMKFNAFLDRVLESYTLFDNVAIKKLINEKETYAKERIDNVIDSLGFDVEKRALDKNLSIDLRLNLADDLLLYTDKITMHHSIEARVPILDLELIAFIESLPHDFKVKFGKTKIIHKALAKKILPPEIINRKKKAFKSPTKQWFETHNNEILELLTNKNSKFSTYFNVEEVAKVVKLHKRGENKEKEIFLLLNFYYWFKNF